YVWAYGLAGKGSPLVGIFYPRKGLKVSDWSFRFQASNPSNQTESTFRLRDDDEITRQREFAVGDENIHCFEYWPPALQRRNIQGPSITFVDCRGSVRLSASFRGEKSDLPAFYNMLEGTKELE